MREITHAHKYVLEGFEKAPSCEQELVFVKMNINGFYEGGTTNEELLEVLIDRTQKLNAKFPSRENALAITKMQEALFWFHEMTKERVVRGVEGKHQK